MPQATTQIDNFLVARRARTRYIDNRKVALFSKNVRHRPVPGGTRLTIVESGFDGIPLTRRLEAFRGNTGGWDPQAENIARHVRESL